MLPVVLYLCARAWNGRGSLFSLQSFFPQLTPFGKRIMFGSDQGEWPGVIGPAIDIIDEAPFLTKEQKADIFYNNAARFLRLSDEEIEAHREMAE